MIIFDEEDWIMTLAPLLDAPPVIQFHAAFAIAAIGLGYRPVARAEGNVVAPQTRVGLGDFDGSRRGNIVVYPYDTDMGALEPHPSPVAVHAGGRSRGCGARATAQYPRPPPIHDLDLCACACRYRTIHVGARTDHEQSDLRRLNYGRPEERGRRRPGRPLRGRAQGHH